LRASIMFFVAVTYGATSLHLDPSKLSPKDRAESEAELKDEALPPEARAKIEKALKLNSPAPEVGKTEEAIKERDSSPLPNANTDETLKKESDTRDNGDFGPLLKLDSKSSAPTPFEKWIETRAKEKIGEHGTKAQLFLMTVISNLPYMML